MKIKFIITTYTHNYFFDKILRLTTKKRKRRIPTQRQIDKTTMKKWCITKNRLIASDNSWKRNGEENPRFETSTIPEVFWASEAIFCWRSTAASCSSERQTQRVTGKYKESALLRTSYVCVPDTTITLLSSVSVLGVIRNCKDKADEPVPGVTSNVHNFQEPLTHHLDNVESKE